MGVNPTNADAINGFLIDKIEYFVVGCERINNYVRHQIQVHKPVGHPPDCQLANNHRMTAQSVLNEQLNQFGVRGFEMIDPD